MSRYDLEQANEIIAELARRKKYNRLAYTFPDPGKGEWSRDRYPYALKFFNAGATYRERAVVAGNRIGKTFMAAFEVALHLTGKYPEWWTGRRFDGPTSIWAAGITNESTKDVIQGTLFGSFLDAGSGLIPKDDIIKIVNRPNSPETIQTAYITHYTDGIADGTSDITLKSYDQGPDKFQGTSKHVVWCDEEPANPKIRSECVTRTMRTTTFTGGMMIYTFTPLLGLSEIVLSFLPGGRLPADNVNPETGSWAMQVTWDECPHLTEQDKIDLMKSYPPHLRGARTRGDPVIGSGAIYQVSEADITYEHFDIPDQWVRAYALDVGWQRTAAVWAAQDPSDLVWYVYSEYYVSKQEPSIHAEGIKSRGDWIPGVVDPAANRSRDDGTRLFQQYLDLGLNLILSANRIEAGISIVWQSLSSGKTKISSRCTNLLNEIRTYHRDEKGKIPDGQDDHLCDALKYLHLTGFSVAQCNPDYENQYYDDYRADKFTLGASRTTGY